MQNYGFSMWNVLHVTFWYVTTLFSSNKLLKLKYIHPYVFLKLRMKKSRCVLWAGKYGKNLKMCSCLSSHNVIVYDCRKQTGLCGSILSALIARHCQSTVLTHTAETQTSTKNYERRQYFRKENPSQYIWSDMRGRAVADEIQYRIRRTLRRTKCS